MSAPYSRSVADVADRHAAADPGGRRAYLTLLFADLCGSSALARRIDAEQLADLLEALRHIAREVVAAQGGEVVRVQGDGVLAVFGHGEASELDAQRACDAALGMHARIASLPPVPLDDGPHRLRMHMGVHAGLVLVRAGGIEHGRLELIGDAPNTAAWLSDLAQPGETLVDTETLGPALNLFDLGPEREMRPPGRARPIAVVSLRGRSGLRRRFEATAQRGLTPFVGRWAELERICAELAGAAARQEPALLTVRGQAGIGKTRFLRELGAQLGALGWLCLSGQADHDPGRRALLPFFEVQRRLRRLQVRDTHGERGEAQALVEAATPDDLHQQLHTLLTAVTPRRPVLLLDDWQWADDASRQLLDALLQSVPGLAAVVATRPVLGPAGVAVPADPQRLFELVPFSADETRATVERWAPGADPFAVAEIHDYAGGVPLLVEELCHTLRRGGVAVVGTLRATEGRAGAPGWMAAMVAARLQGLPPALQTVVRSAAVLGSSIPLWLLAEMVSNSVDDAVLDALREADFLYPAEPGVWRFKHALTRDAVYELVPLATRRSLHAEAVRVLSEVSGGRSGEVAPADLDEALAHHTAAAGLWAEAVGRCERAGDRALAKHAFDRARRQYRAAIDAAQRAGLEDRAAVQRWSGLVHKLGMTCIFDPLALPDVLPLFEAVHASACEQDDALARARSAYWLAYIAYGFGQPRRAVLCCREALGAAQQGGDQRLATQIAATLGQALAAAGAYDEALQAMEQALQAKRQQSRRGGAIAVGSAFTLACRAAVLADRGDFTEAHAALAEARTLLGETLHPVANSVRNWSMVILAWQGRWDETLAVVEATERMAERSRALLPLAIARAAGGYARWRRDGDAAAVEQIAEAVRWMEERRCAFFTSIFHGWLVEAHATAGRWGELRHHAARALHRARAGERLGEAAAWRALAVQAAAAGQAERARRRLLRADASARARASAREQGLNDSCRAALRLTVPAAS